MFLYATQHYNFGELMYPKLMSKINKLEKEVNELKISMMESKVLGEKVSLKGFFKGIKITELDIENAKKSLFSGV